MAKKKNNTERKKNIRQRSLDELLSSEQLHENKTKQTRKKRKTTKYIYICKLNTGNENNNESRKANGANKGNN